MSKFCSDVPEYVFFIAEEVRSELRNQFDEIPISPFNLFLILSYAHTLYERRLESYGCLDADV